MDRWSDTDLVSRRHRTLFHSYHAAVSEQERRRDARPKKKAAQAPRLAASAGLEWRASERLGLFLAARHEGARFDDDLNTRRLAAATTLNLSARYGVSRSTRLEIDLRNALDAGVATGRTGDGVTSDDAPRSLRVGVVYVR